MSNEVIIPADLKAPSPFFRDQNVRTEGLDEGLDGSGMPIIGVNGKEFYLRYKGTRYTLINPPSDPPTPYDGLPARSFDFVILRKNDRRSHTYYKDGYKKGESGRPTCVSTDGIAPDDSVPSDDKQADACDICDKHVWKRQPNGRDGRACADSLRLAVFAMPEQIKAVLGEPISEPCLFRIPAASLSGISELGKEMVKRFGDAPYCSYIVRASFMQKVEWPQFEYRVVRFLSDTEGKTIMELRESPEAYRILGKTPEGRSLVRRETVQVVNAPMPVQGNQTVTYSEPLMIEGKAEEVVRPKPTLVKTPVAESSAEIDAIVTSMRPRPPAGK